jgi:single-strand DNA-binding protein
LVSIQRQGIGFANPGKRQKHTAARVDIREEKLMTAVNLVTLVGRVGTEPEVKYFESGSVLCNLTLAVRRRTSRDDKPDWFNLELWGKAAEVAANYVHKGSLIGVTGALKLDYWQDRATGTPRSKPVIRVDRLDLLGSRRDNENTTSYGEEEF